MIKTPSFWANRLQEAHFGRIVIGMVQFIFNVTILLKLFDAAWWMYIVGLFTASFLTWYTGRFLEKKGIRRYFREAEFKNVKLDK